jgi:hypothetical protein
MKSKFTSNPLVLVFHLVTMLSGLNAQTFNNPKHIPT